MDGQSDPDEVTPVRRRPEVAPVTPTRSRLNDPKFNRNVMIVVFGGLLLLVIGIRVFVTTPPEEHAAAAQATSAPPTVVDVTADPVRISDLLGTYRDNEVRGDSLYKGRWLYMRAVVNGVTKDVFGSIHVEVGTGNQFETPTVDCLLREADAKAAGRLHRGGVITLAGQVDGLNLMSVVLGSCQLMQAPSGPQ